MNHPTLSYLIRSCLIIANILILVGCSTIDEKTVKIEHHFELAILDSKKISLAPRDYKNYDTLWPVLKDAYPKMVILKITEADITTYNWTNQEIVLSTKASNAIFNMIGCPDLHLTDTYPFCLEGIRFVVAVDDEPLYGGVSTTPRSPLADKFPVIYAGIPKDNPPSDNDLVLTILPSKPIGFYDKPGWDVIKDERIKTIFSDLGKLIE